MLCNEYIALVLVCRRENEMHHLTRFYKMWPTYDWFTLCVVLPGFQIRPCYIQLCIDVSRLKGIIYCTCSFESFAKAWDDLCSCSLWKKRKQVKAFAVCVLQALCIYMYCYVNLASVCLFCVNERQTRFMFWCICGVKWWFVLVNSVIMNAHVFDHHVICILPVHTGQGQIWEMWKHTHLF